MLAHAIISSMPKGYPKVPRTEEEKRIISEKISQALIGKPRPDVTQRQTEKKLSEEHRKNISNGKSGKTIPAMSRALTGRTLSPETRKKIGQSVQGKNGELSRNWKGTDAKYDALHAWARKYFVDPGLCEFCNSVINLQWSSKYDRPLSRNQDDWQRLCVKCHRRYDNKHGPSGKTASLPKPAPGYIAAHTWARRHLKDPKCCQVCDSTEQLHWANRDHQYRRDSNDWSRLCKQCHVRYDMTGQFFGKE